MSEPPEIKRLDQAVVNRIAAGEIIQRPANALKELIENSLDAKSTNIQIVVKNGGLKFLQIQDNGTGIRREDFEIVCERFTTSKLRSFEDLQSISTYGFRGEALASMSHIAHLTIVSKTSKDICAYKASYIDGKLQGAPKPIAGNQGTIITVEDLFFNMTVRKLALRSLSEEYQKVSDVVSKYAIHNPKVGFSLKKSGGNNDIRTTPDSNCIENIRIIYGNTVARELIEFSLTNQPFKFKASGYITNVNYSTKSFTFILFINHRLVECQGLKKNIDYVYTTYLPKNMHPFVYLSLELDPTTVDVNVHPTKHEVQFLNQEQIVEAIATALEGKLLGSNNSRVFYTQAKLPNVQVETWPLKDEAENKMNKTVNPKDMVRTDSTTQKLEKFFGAPVKKTNAHPSNNKQEQNAKADASLTEEDFQKHNKEFLEKNEKFEDLLNKTDGYKNGREKKEGEDHNFMEDDLILGGHTIYESEVVEDKTNTDGRQVTNKDEKHITDMNESIEHVKNRNGECTSNKTDEHVTNEKSEHIASKNQVHEDIKPNGFLSKDLISRITRVQTQLTSVLQLRKSVEENCHHTLRDLFAHHVFVGTVNPEQALIQHSTKVYLCNTRSILQELFYQFVLYNFQNFFAIVFAQPLPMKELILLALDEPETGWTEEDGDKGELADNAVALLSEKAEMLQEYFSLEIDKDGNLKTIPVLLDSYFPNDKFLPMYLLRLATEVNWESEKECFNNFARETALYFCRVDTDTVSGENDWKWVTEHILYPAIKEYFIPPKTFINNAAVLEIANLANLYKVFERC